MTRLILPTLGAVKLADLDRVKVDKWRAGLPAVTTAGESHLGAKVLKMALKAAVEAGVIPRNPVGTVRRPPGGVVKEVGRRSRDQVKQLLTAAEGTTYEAYWWLAVDAGMRPGEVLALHWPDIDLDRGTVRVNESLSWQDGQPVL